MGRYLLETVSCRQNMVVGDQRTTAELHPPDAPQVVLHVGHVGVLVHRGLLTTHDAVYVLWDRCKINNKLIFS